MRGHVIVGVMIISTDVDKPYDTDLTDAAWALIAPMLPAAPIKRLASGEGFNGWITKSRRTLIEYWRGNAAMRMQGKPSLPTGCLFKAW